MRNRRSVEAKFAAKQKGLKTPPWRWGRSALDTCARLMRTAARLALAALAGLLHNFLGYFLHNLLGNFLSHAQSSFLNRKCKLNLILKSNQFRASSPVFFDWDRSDYRHIPPPGLKETPEGKCNTPAAE